MKNCAAFHPHLAQCQHPFLGSHNAALHHDEVIGHLSVVDKSTLFRRKWNHLIFSLYRATKSTDGWTPLTRGLMLLLHRS